MTQSRSFATVGPSNWNKLLQSLRDLFPISSYQFRKHLKTSLFVSEDIDLGRERLWYKWRNINLWLQLQLRENQNTAVCICYHRPVEPDPGLDEVGGRRHGSWHPYITITFTITTPLLLLLSTIYRFGHARMLSLTWTSASYSWTGRRTSFAHSPVWPLTRPWSRQQHAHRR